MKTAYSYTRISQEDQSHFSLEAQEKINSNFAERQNINVLKAFVDDGYSAGDFNRPGWKALEEELSKNRSKVDYLIVMKYDRMIRNTVEGLIFIKKLEQKWNIKLISVMENYSISPADPMFKKMRGYNLIDAEFERDRISDRSKMGNWAAKDAGRFIGRAPIGYQNIRDEEDLPIIAVDEKEKPYVIQIFEDFLNGVTLGSIYKKTVADGFRLKGHDALKRVLTNHVYAGLIQVPAYKEEPAKTVKGIHQPIISEDTFWKAYYKLQDQIRPQGPKIIDDNLPLRGVVLCQQCGGLHTGGRSKGRNAYYYYYRCLRCREENYSIIPAHKELATILAGLSLPEDMVQATIANTEKLMVHALKDRQSKVKRVEKECGDLKAKLDSLEEKFISNKIEQVTYEKWFPIFSRDLNGKANELKELSKDTEEYWTLFNSHLPYLTDLNFIYEKEGVEEKQALLKHIFLGGLIKEKEGYRTGLLQDPFALNISKTKGFLRITKTGNLSKSDKSPVCTPSGNQIEPLLRIVAKIIKKAA